MNTSDTNRLELALGKVLGAGTAVSATLLAVGLLLELAGVRSTVARTLDSAGLIVLMATPLLRVTASVLEYLLARDWLFATLTTMVLVTLLGSLFVAMR